MTDNAQTKVIVAGGGVAAIEAMLALRDVAGDRVAITCIAPRADFVYRPLSVGEPFALGHALTLPLATVARDVGAELRTDSLAAVDTDAHSVRLESGETQAYDALLVAIGARRTAALKHARTFRGQEDSESLHGLIQDLEGGYSRRIVFVVPAGVAWSLPIYELALMTAQRAHEMSIPDVELTIVTPEERPLAVFGPGASDDLERMLEAAGIAVETSARAEIPGSGLVVLHPHGRTLEADRIVALPVTSPIQIDGLPRDRDGFIPVDAHGRVRDTEDVYAAGDGTSFPVKQGGLACQQADAAADMIAVQAGVELEPAPFKPVLRGELRSGGEPLFVRNDISGAVGDRSKSSGHILWWPPGKVAGAYLAPYLAEREQQRPGGKTPPIHRSYLVPEATGEGHGIELLGLDLAAPQRA